MPKRTDVVSLVIGVMGLFHGAAGAEPFAPYSLDPAKTMQAVRVNTTGPVIDGVLDDDIWEHAPEHSGFIQRSPVEGAPASEPTVIQVAYDDAALYIGVMAYDKEPEKIVARLARRDMAVETDWVHITLDSNRDQQTAFSFFVNAAGALIDGYYYNDIKHDLNWDGIWEAQSSINSEGWSTELKIPYSILHFGSGEEYKWGINIDRYISRKQESQFWIMVPRRENAWVSRLGVLDGIANIKPPRSIEFLPYSMSRSTVNSAGGEKVDFASDLGLDMHYNINSNISFDAALNPDFGQVEADPSVLNLTAFETFFTEKRPFFVKNSKIFETPIRLFYSRRIGRKPGHLPVPAGFQVSDRPNLTTIIEAAKVAGRTSERTSFGLMQAVTGSEHATVIGTSPVAGEGAEVGKVKIEPLANYTVGRVQRDVLEGNSFVGLMLTSVNRRSSTSAYTGGVDWHLRWANSAYQFSGQVAGSRAEKSDLRQGYAANFDLARRSGGIQGGAFLEAFSPGFESNDLGFISRNDKVDSRVWLSLRSDRKTNYFRQRLLTTDYNASWNYDSLNLDRTLEADGQLITRAYWLFHGKVAYAFRSFDDINTRGGPPILDPARRKVWVRIESDKRKKLIGRLIASREEDDAGSVWRSVSARVGIKPTNKVEIRLEPAYRWNSDDAQWLANEDADADGVRDRFIYGELDSKVFSFTSRLDMMFTRDLSLQLYLQPFVAVGDFGRIKTLDKAKSYSFTPYPDYASDPDFKRRSFRSNFVVRWEYAAGSTLFLVWSQSRSAFLDEPSLRPFESIGRSFTDGGSNIFLLKFNHWFSI